MGKIEITQEQMEVIQQHLNGEFGMFTATDHQMKVLSEVIYDADKLMEELDAYDDLDDIEDGDTIRWYLNKYNEQNAE